MYIRHDIYVYNFSSLSINVRNICTKPDRRLKVFIYVMIFVSKEVFLIHNNLVTQKIFYCEIIHQSCKQCLFFIYEGECVLIFLNIRSFFSTNFIFINVSRNRCNLIIAKMFLTDTIITGKSLWGLAFESAVLHVYIYLFILSFFDLRR